MTWAPGAEPTGTRKLSYTIHANAAADYAGPRRAERLHRRPLSAGRTRHGRRPAGRRADPRRARPTRRRQLPLVHVLIPYEFGASPPAEPLYRSFGYGWENMHDALDGIAIDIPALKVKPTHGDAFPLNIQIKDPIWPMRNLMDVSVSVKPGEARTVWLDTRDRILPNKSLYLTIAGAGPDFDAAQLDGAKIRLVFKDRAAGLPEHIADRLNQVKDNWGFLVEEHTASKRESRSTTAWSPTPPTCCASIPTTASAASTGPTSPSTARGPCPSPSRRRRPACRCGPSASSRT